MTNSSMYGSNPTPTSYRDIDLLVSTAENAANTAIANGNSATASAAAAQASAGNASTSASGAATSATNAASSAADALSSKNAAALSATNAATSATSASNSASSATTSATTATNAATSATTSASSASTAASQAATSQSAAATSATNAATSATAAAASATTASTQATAAAASNASAATHDTNAAASATLANDWATKTSGPVAGGEYSAKYNAQQAATSASGAATSATNAASSATSASGSATTATTQATAASTSATNAANSASAAATSATNAASSATAAASSASSAASAVSSALTSYYDKTASDARFAFISHTHTASQISDSTTAGRALLTAADVTAQRTALGLGTAATQASTAFAAAVHTHVSTDITDSTATGRSLLTTASASAARTTLGLGTAALNATTDFVGQTATTGAASVPAGTTAQRPASPVAGQLRYNSTTGKFEGYGSAWGNIGGGATISDTAPSNPAAGDLWWRSSEGTMYVYYTDADSSQWVAASPDGTGQYLPLTGGTVTGGVNLATTSGNVGIGTSSPTAPLDVRGTSGLIRTTSTTGTNTTNIGFTNTGGSFYIGLDSSTGGNFGAGSYGATLYNGANSPMAFFTNAAERMRIDASGNVLLGKSSATTYEANTKLNVYSSAVSQNFNVLQLTSLLSSGANVGDIVGIGFAAGESTAYGVKGSIGYVRTGSYGTGALAFYLNNSLSTSSVSTSDERMRIDSSGNLLVGTTTLPISGARVGISGSSGVGSGIVSYVNTNASTKKWMNGPDSNGNFVTFNDASAGAYISYGGTSWTSSSDERLKTDLVPISDAANKVSSLRAVTGRFKTDVEGTSRAFLIAQDVQKVLPEAVDTSDPEKLGVAYTDVIPLLVAAIKEQQALIESLTTRIANLESK